MIRFFSEVKPSPVYLGKLLKPVIRRICREHGRGIEYLNVIFVNDERLLEINRQFLKHDYYTDIITFNYAEDPQRNIEGELYVSMDRVKDNAAKLGVDADEETARVVVHGVLHLCGFKDKLKKDKGKMQTAESQYVAGMFHVKHKSNV